MTGFEYNLIAANAIIIAGSSIMSGAIKHPGDKVGDPGDACSDARGQSVEPDANANSFARKKTHASPCRSFPAGALSVRPDA
jgi:hypothetical protein